MRLAAPLRSSSTLRKRSPQTSSWWARVGRSPVTEVVLGSVSHRVLTYAFCPTLIVKGNARSIRQVLVAIEGQEDAGRIKKWILMHPFKEPVGLSLLTVVPSPQMTDPADIVGFQAWSDTAMRYAEDLVKETGAALMGTQYTVSTCAVTGEPAIMVAQQASGMDLVVVASYSRKG